MTELEKSYLDCLITKLNQPRLANEDLRSVQLLIIIIMSSSSLCHRRCFMDRECIDDVLHVIKRDVNLCLPIIAYGQMRVNYI